MPQKDNTLSVVPKQENLAYGTAEIPAVDKLYSKQLENLDSKEQLPNEKERLANKFRYLGDKKVHLENIPADRLPLQIISPKDTPTVDLEVESTYHANKEDLEGIGNNVVQEVTSEEATEVVSKERSEQDIFDSFIKSLSDLGSIINDYVDYFSLKSIYSTHIGIMVTHLHQYVMANHKVTHLQGLAAYKAKGMLYGRTLLNKRSRGYSVDKKGIAKCIKVAEKFLNKNKEPLSGRLKGLSGKGIEMTILKYKIDVYNNLVTENSFFQNPSVLKELRKRLETRKNRK